MVENGCENLRYHRLMELEEAPISWTIVKLVFLRKPDTEPKKKESEVTGLLR